MKTVLTVKESPHILLLLTAFVLLVALAFRPIVNIDFQDKTVFDVPVNSMVWIIPLFLLSFWLLYLFTRNFLYSRTITWTRASGKIPLYCAVLNLFGKKQAFFVSLC